MVGGFVDEIRRSEDDYGDDFLGLRKRDSGKIMTRQLHLYSAREGGFVKSTAMLCDQLRHEEETVRKESGLTSWVHWQRDERKGAGLQLALARAAWAEAKSKRVATHEKVKIEVGWW